MAQYPQARPGQGSRGGQDERRDFNTGPTIDTSKVLFKGIEPKLINPDLFNGIASETAEIIAGAKKETNKPTQLRRFYDEIVMWEGKAGLHPEKFAEYLPFIRMMNAKAAYALGRKLVDENFAALINHGLKQVETYPDLRHFKLFMEAFMGFYKEKRPKD